MPDVLPAELPQSPLIRKYDSDSPGSASVSSSSTSPMMSKMLSTASGGKRKPKGTIVDMSECMGMEIEDLMQRRESGDLMQKALSDRPGTHGFRAGHLQRSLMLKL